MHLRAVRLALLYLHAYKSNPDTKAFLVRVIMLTMKITDYSHRHVLKTKLRICIQCSVIYPLVQWCQTQFHPGPHQHYGCKWYLASSLGPHQIKGLEFDTCALVEGWRMKLSSVLAHELFSVQLMTAHFPLQVWQAAAGLSDAFRFQHGELGPRAEHGHPAQRGGRPHRLVHAGLADALLLPPPLGVGHAEEPGPHHVPPGHGSHPVHFSRVSFPFFLFCSELVCQ